MVATVVLLPVALVAPPGELPPLDALASLAALGAVCTALGLVLFFRLIAVAGPSRASVITYVNPLVAVVLGVAVLGEELGHRVHRGAGADPGGLLASPGSAPRSASAPAAAARA